MSNFFRKINRYLNRVIIILGLRRGQNYWGVVYDSATKQPLDPAVVKLMKVSSGEVVASCITDLNGRYGFLAAPGRYKIFVKKTNYTFPSQAVTRDRDGIFHNVYRGEFFDLVGDTEVIPFNIPMDPAGVDWNQQAKEKITNFFPFFEDLLQRLVAVLFWFVFILALARFVTSPNDFVKYLLIFYGLMFFLAFVLPHNRMWGRVLEVTNGQPPFNCVVALSPKKVPQVVVARAAVSDYGKFFLRAEPGSYILQIKQTQADGQEKVLFTQNRRIGSEGLVNDDFWI